MNKKIKYIGGFILALLCIMIFMSKTMYTINIPIVTGAMPTNGKLKKSESTTGFTKWAKTEDIYSDLSGKVENILVNEGDKVTTGQKLIEFSFDKDQILSDIKQLGIDREKLLLSIETIKLKNEKTKKDIAALESEKEKEIEYDKPDNVPTFEIEQLEIKIKNDTEELEKTKILYESGIIPLSELESANTELEKLIDQHKNLIAQREELIRKNEETQRKAVEKLKETNEDLKKARQKELTNLNYSLTLSNQDLKEKDIELKNISNKEVDLKNKLEKIDQKTFVLAKKDGIITSIPIKAGQFAAENVLLISFGLGDDFEIECDVSISNNFISVGDECKLKNSTNLLTGTVSKVSALEKNKKITINIKADKLEAGESFEIKFAKETEKSYTLIPNSAVNKDTTNYYVYTIKKRDGILGEEYYVEKTNIEVIDTDSKNSAISSEKLFLDPIVILSNKPFSDKGTVVLENEGDFYVK